MVWALLHNFSVPVQVAINLQLQVKPLHGILSRVRAQLTTQRLIFDQPFNGKRHSLDIASRHEYPGRLIRPPSAQSFRRRFSTLHGQSLYLFGYAADGRRHDG